MGIEPQVITFNEEALERAPLSALRGTEGAGNEHAVKYPTAEIGVEYVAKGPIAMSFDETAPEDQLEDRKIQTNNHNSTIQEEASSDVDEIASAATECEVTNVASNDIPTTNTVESSQTKLLNAINRNLEDFADIEQQTITRDPVFIHYMLGDTIIGEYSGFVGDKITLPSLTDIADIMGDAWDSSIFIGWDSDGIVHDSSDIVAILRKTFVVRILLDSNEIGIITAVDGTKVSKVLEKNFDKLGLKPPLFANYSIYCNSKIITCNSTIRVQSKSPGDVGRKVLASESKQAIVVFAIRPSDMGLDISNMTKEEIRDATIIQRVTVNVGDSVTPPSETVLRNHGVRLPFNQYYSWSRDFDNITEDTIIKAVTKRVTEVQESVNYLSADSAIQTSRGILKHAVNMLAHPTTMFAEHKLLKEFERGRILRARDFTFLRWKGELMLCKYSGVNPIVEIPAMVNGMYVKYLHPRALTSGAFKFNGLFGKGKQSAFERISSASAGITEVILPKTIKYLPSNFLYEVSNVETLVIPETVSEISPSAFDGSALLEIYFDGMCPRGFDRNNTDAEIFVRRKSYKSFF